MTVRIQRQSGPKCYMNARGRWTRNWEWILLDDENTCVGVFYKKAEAVAAAATMNAEDENA